jgi:hypothetical protein
MANVRYLGPAGTLNGKPVPPDGLNVNLSAEVVATMRRHGHQFADAAAEEAPPTPQEVNAEANAKAKQ